MTNKCKGKNCTAVNGVNHSKECELEHDLNTAGNRNPAARYAGYKNHPLHDKATFDEVKAWEEGLAARGR